MKIKISGIFLSLLILLILVVSVAVTNSFSFAKNRAVSLSNRINQPYPYPAPETAEPWNTLTPIPIKPSPTLQPSPTPFPPITWSELPLCQNNPLSDADWEKTISTLPNDNKTLKFYLRKISSLSPVVGSLSPENFKAILHSNPTASVDQEKKQLLILLLNIASGRINRSTEIGFADLPDIKTTGDLQTKLEEAFSGGNVSSSYIDAAKSLQVGNGIGQPVCAQLLVSKVGNDIKKAKWTKNEIQKENINSDPIASLQKLLSGGVPSPNGQWVAFVSSGRDTGGPIFLLNMKSGELINLIGEVNKKMPDDQKLNEGDYWNVVDWFPNSKQIMIGADLSSVFVVDLSSYDLQFIPLKSERMGGNEIASLSPDGKGFVFIGNEPAGPDGLEYYDFKSQKTTRVFSLPMTGEILHFPRYSPDGKYVSYVIEKGQLNTGVTYSINLYSFDTGNSITLIDGNIGLSIPVWSPDGEYLAFLKKEPDVPDVAKEDLVPDRPQANLWVVSMDKKFRQVTSIHGRVLHPAWSNDGKFIAFTTHDGQVGVANINQPDQIWQIDSASTSYPLFTGAVFIP